MGKKKENGQKKCYFTKPLLPFDFPAQKQTPSQLTPLKSPFPGRARGTPGMGLCWRQLPVAPARRRRRAPPRRNADEAVCPVGAGTAAGGWRCLDALPASPPSAEEGGSGAWASSPPPPQR